MGYSRMTDIKLQKSLGDIYLRILSYADCEIVVLYTLLLELFPGPTIIPVCAVVQYFPIINFGEIFINLN